MATEGRSSDTPGGDLTEHGADAAERVAGESGVLGEHPAQEPGGDLTEHGADPDAHDDTTPRDETPTP